MKTRGWYFVALLVLGICAAEGGVGTWQNYTSMKDVKGIARSGHKYWAATSGGLFRWDEGTESYLKLTNAEGLLSIDLTAVGIDSTGDVWSGTSGGILHIYTPSSGSLRTVLDIATVPGQTNKGIRSLSMIGDTALICTDFGMSVYRISRREFGDTFTKFGSIPPNVRVSVSSATIYGGRIWATVSDGLTNNAIASAPLSAANLLEPGAWTLSSAGLPGTIPVVLAVFAGRLYAGTTSGLYFFDGTAWQGVAALSGKSLLALSSSPDVLDAYATSGDVFMVDAAMTVKTYGGVLPFSGTSLVAGSDGTPVIGTLSGGVLTYGTAWTSHFPNGPNSNQFVSVTVSPDGALWAGSGESSGRGFYRFDGKVWKSLTKANSKLPADEVYRVSVGCDGTVWASTYGRGIVEMPPGAETVDSTQVFGQNVGMVGIVNDPTYIVNSTVACDSRGNLWTTTVLAADKNIVAVRTPDRRWHTLPVFWNGSKVETLQDRPTDHCLAVDAADNLWAVVRDPSVKGVFAFRNGGTTDLSSVVHVTSADGLPSDDVRTIVVDNDNDIWVGTDRGIAIIVDPSNPTRSGGIAAYKPLNGLVINAIAVDPLNQKWVATSEGVILLSPDGTQQLASFTVESTAGKLIENDVKSVAVDPASGTVYFGTTSGLASLSTSAAAPTTAFDHLLVYPNPYTVPNTIPLTVDGLVANSSLKIIATDGSLVRELKTPGGRVGFWDGTDESGRTVATGVYIVVGYSEDGTQSGLGKVAVIRH